MNTERAKQPLKTAFMEFKRSEKGAKLDGWREKAKEFHCVVYVLGLKDNLLLERGTLCAFSSSREVNHILACGQALQLEESLEVTQEVARARKETCV